MSYKKQHETFLSNLNGTSPLEISLVATTATWSVLLYHVLAVWFLQFRHWPASFRFIFDVIVLMGPSLLNLTILSEHVGTIQFTMLCTVIGLLVCTDKINQTVKKKKEGRQKSWYEIFKEWSEEYDVRHFITWYRAYVLIATVICILSVDFKVFPRRFAKTENYGTGFMDVGVGSFVISNAIVSPTARGKRMQGLFKTIMSALPLLVLGIARMVSVKATGYQEHVSEYGVHWNFFFTLSFVMVAGEVVLRLLKPWHGCIVGILIAVMYQYVLNQYSLNTYILHGRNGDGSRDTFIDANREGIFSCFGYLALYLVGVQLGTFLFKERKHLQGWIICLVQLVMVAVLLWLDLAVCQRYLEPVSRRMANLTYVLWMMLYNVVSLSSFLLMQIVIQFLSKTILKNLDSKLSPDSLLSAITYNGLFYFLLANIMTGIVNFSMKTIHADKTISMGIITMYICFLSFVLFILFRKNIKLKFW